MVLVTSIGDDLSQALASALGSEYHVRLAKAEEAGEQLRGCQALVCLNPEKTGKSDSDLLDCRTRVVYDLLNAATAAQVPLVIYLSSLNLLAGYPDSYTVQEDFQPQPTAEAESLSHYLGEFVCREFAREGKLRVVILRRESFPPASGGQTAPTTEQPAATKAICQAVQRALAAGLRSVPARLAAWEVIHIPATLPNERFNSNKAQRLLGYVSKS